MHKLFILTILLFYLLFIEGKWKVEKNGKELFLFFGGKWLRPKYICTLMINVVYTLIFYNITLIISKPIIELSYFSYTHKSLSK